MSDPSRTHAPTPTPATEEREDVFMDDVIPGGRLARIGAISIVVGLVGVFAAFALLRASGGTKPGPADDAPQAAAAIGMVEQTSIEDQRRGLAVREEQRASLERAAWIDRDAGLAQRPIDRAIDDVVKMYNGSGVLPDGGAR